MLLDSKWQKMVDCSSFYQDLLQGGVPLTDGSNFFFLNNYNGRVSYLGVMRYANRVQGPITMYIEFESRYTKDVMGHTFLSFLLRLFLVSIGRCLAGVSVGLRNAARKKPSPRVRPGRKR